MVAAHARALLVPAKLTPPQPLATWITRQRLLDCLDSTHTRLVLVVAPAGFGKSTLVAQWVAARCGAAGRRQRASELVGASPFARERLPPPEAAWLTLNEHDQDPLRFLAYLAGAVTRVAPDALPVSRELLSAPAPPPLHMLLDALLVELGALPGGLTLVLDDYHTITDEAVHQTVAYLLRHFPADCRLVLLGRVDPPLPLTRLRAEQQVTEVRAADLRFTAEETGALLAQLQPGPPDLALVASLHAQTEGWVIALQLAVLAQNDQLAQAYGGGASARQIAEYLADEVFDRQPAAFQQALLALAVPERFCAGLCAALLELPDDCFQAEDLLEQLLRANLFLLALDAEGGWYRFHPLFRDLLLRRLRLMAGADTAQALHLRAARWLAAEELVEEAVRHYLAAGAHDMVAEIVEGQLCAGMDQDGAVVSSRYWLRMLPAELLAKLAQSAIARRPALALTVARQAVANADLAGLEASLAHLDALSAGPDAAGDAPPWPSFPADLAALRGVLSSWQGRPAATISAMRAALAQGPTPALAAQALIQLGLAYVGHGAYAEGVQLIAAGLPEAAGGLGDQQALCQPGCLAAMHQLAGELAAQEHEARRLTLVIAERAAGDQWRGYAAASLGLAAYERADLDAAAEQFGALAGRTSRVGYPVFIGGVIGLALVAAARGAFAEAAALAHEATTLAGEAGGAFLRNQALGCAVRVALARGDYAEALEAAGSIGVDLHLGVSLALETPRLSQVQALIATGEAAYLARAETLLAGCLAEIVPLHHTRLQIKALALQALLRHAQGRQGEAGAALTQALALAGPRGFVRTFVDLGPQIVPLLRPLASQPAAPAFVAQVLAACAPRAERADQPQSGARGADLPERLTRRELEILALLAERWSDKEIASQLVIAPSTVRKHTSTIYEKLGVGSRREAVHRARTLGLV